MPQNRRKEETQPLEDDFDEHEWRDQNKQNIVRNLVAEYISQKKLFGNYGHRPFCTDVNVYGQKNYADRKNRLVGHGSISTFLEGRNNLSEPNYRPIRRYVSSAEFQRVVPAAQDAFTSFERFLVAGKGLVEHYSEDVSMAEAIDYLSRLEGTWCFCRRLPKGPAIAGRNLMYFYFKPVAGEGFALLNVVMSNRQKSFHSNTATIQGIVCISELLGPRRPTLVYNWVDPLSRQRGQTSFKVESSGLVGLGLHIAQISFSEILGLDALWSSEGNEELSPTNDDIDQDEPRYMLWRYAYFIPAGEEDEYPDNPFSIENLGWNIYDRT